LIVETFGNFNIKMHELGLPANALKNSYRNDGQRIYLNKSNTNPDASEDKFAKFKGWYAKES
jgi:formylmethanofuran dehydrogenase subunit E